MDARFLQLHTLTGYSATNDLLLPAAYMPGGWAKCCHTANWKHFAASRALACERSIRQSRSNTA